MGTRIGSFRGVARMWLHFSALVLTLKLTKLQPLVTFTIIGLQNYHLNGYHPNHRVAALQYSAQYNMISPRRQRTRVSQSVCQSCIQSVMHSNACKCIHIFIRRFKAKQCTNRHRPVCLRLGSRSLCFLSACRLILVLVRVERCIPNAHIFFHHKSV